MPADINADALAAVLDRFAQRRPLRAGSLIVTVFGDAIAPRGGSLWLGSLLEIMQLFGVDGGHVRTALTRLVQEGWFERSRSGKNSFYRLSPVGAEKFAEATQRIYHAAEPAWDGTFDLALLGADPKQRAAPRDALAAHGFGQAAPTVMLRPKRAARPDLPDDAGVIWLTSSVEGHPSDARKLANAAWQLGDLEQAYVRFIEVFQPLLSNRRNAKALDDAQAVRLRLLLLHEYRRIVLRDPLLPKPLLPAGWSGLEARMLCRTLYKMAIPGSERWLDAHATALAGPLPVPDAAFWERFA